MTVKNELARDIFLADNTSAAPGLMEREWDENPTTYHYAHHIAERLIAKGYRKPRTITTAEELDALILGTVIRSEHRHYLVAHKEDGDAGRHGWAAAGTGQIPVDLVAWLPATVLWEPEVAA